MPSPTTCTTRQLAAELRYQVHSKGLHVVCLLVAVGAALAFTVSISHAQATHEHFVRQVQLFESNGVSLRSALSAPLTVTQDAGSETIDNPLKYDYLEVGRAVQAVDGATASIGTALDLVTFILLPLVFLVLGANAATFDRRAGTMKLRASRDRWGHVVAAKLLSIGVLAAAATAATAVTAVVCSVVGAGRVAALTGGIEYQLPSSDSTSPLVLKLLTTVLVATFFGVVGFALGAATGSTSWPMVAAAGALFLLPFVSAWDPRNLLAALGTQVYDFRGQFQLRPPLEVALPAAAAVLLAYFLIALAVSLALPRTAKRYA